MNSQPNCECPYCLRDMPHPYSGPPIKYTTVVICSNGKVYDLGKLEYPSGKDMPINAYCCTVEEAERLKANAKKN